MSFGVIATPLPTSILSKMAKDTKTRKSRWRKILNFFLCSSGCGKEKKDSTTDNNKNDVKLIYISVSETGIVKHPKQFRQEIKKSKSELTMRQYLNSLIYKPPRKSRNQQRDITHLTGKETLAVAHRNVQIAWREAELENGVEMGMYADGLWIIDNNGEDFGIGQDGDGWELIDLEN